MNASVAPRGERPPPNTLWGREALAVPVEALAGVVFTPAQHVLFSIAGIGLLAAVLTRFLTPEQFIPADIGRAVFSPLARNADAIAGQLGLSATRVYLVTGAGPRLYLPKRRTYELPSESDLVDPFVIGDEATTGLSLEPSGRDLLDKFEVTHRGPIPDDPRELAVRLADGATEGREISTGIEVDVDNEDGRATFEVATAAFGPLCSLIIRSGRSWLLEWRVASKYRLRLSGRLVMTTLSSSRFTWISLTVITRSEFIEWFLWPLFRKSATVGTATGIAACTVNVGP